MRAAAVALVLIVGAAVVLWYGNTLNSWVLGGLIGGLAALLISIPISLLLFSYLARRHDVHARADAEEESLAAWESYDRPESPIEVYEARAYALAAAEEEWDVEPLEYRVARGRSQTALTTNPRLPAARQSPGGGERALESQRSQQPRAVPPARVKEQAATPQRPHPRTAQPVHYPGFPGYRADTQRSAYNMAALRAARYEAARQHTAGYAQIIPAPAPTSKRLPAVRPEQRIVAQQPVQPRVVRQARSSQPQQAQAPQQYRPRRTVEGSSLHAATHRSLAKPVEDGEGQAPQGRYLRERETQTDKLGGLSPLTGPVRQQITDQLARNPQLDARRRNPDVISGSLKNPLLRRAPYMYEDDPMRQEMAQHIEAPPVRRSSRYLDYAADQE